MLFVTGGAGFIGSNFLRRWIDQTGEPVLNIDALTYAGNLSSVADLNPNICTLEHQDICDGTAIATLFARHQPRAIVHFAAESHVDRSIHGPAAFVRTNITGTFELLEAARHYWNALDAAQRDQFRFLHVSTDEVFGSLGPKDAAFHEGSAYAPNSPYSASKAASDHLVRAYHHTYGLPTLTTHCSNNYGPYQFPEKLIPLMISNALAGRPLPVYGDGKNVRDWLYVTDHCDALIRVLADGANGSTYNIGGWNEMSNIDVVSILCGLLDERLRQPHGTHARLITFVTDRPGHDRRYAIDATKIERELGWKPLETFETGLAKTVDWYLAHGSWVADIQSGAYLEWVKTNYGDRVTEGNS